MRLKISILIFITLLITSCGFVKYSFKDGASKYEGNKKIFIPQFENSAGKGPSDIPTTFTEKTKEYYQQNGDFTLVNLNEDLKLECEITSYRVDIAGATSADKAQQYKLTIGVNVIFYDYQAEKEEDRKITKNISQFETYDANVTLSDIEIELIGKISDQLILEIFNQTVTTTEW